MGGRACPSFAFLFSFDRPMLPEIPPYLLAGLRRIKFFVCDVDGVLTDATVIMGEGFEAKPFHIRDGFGLRLLQSADIRVGWISARPSTATTERANDLKIDFVRQSTKPKVGLIEELLVQTGVAWPEVLYMGDDVVDLGAMKRAGVAVAPSDAIPEVRAAAHYVCRLAGGRGAVREIVDLLLRAQGKWEPLIAKFSE